MCDQRKQSIYKEEVIAIKIGVSRTSLSGINLSGIAVTIALHGGQDKWNVLEFVWNSVNFESFRIVNKLDSFYLCFEVNLMY